MKFKKNDIIEAEIVDITNLGFGVAKAEGQVIFVSDAIPGDKCKIRISFRCLYQEVVAE